MRTIAATGIFFCVWFMAFDRALAQMWMQTGAKTNFYWTSVASSADGTKLAATADQGTGQGIYLSTNSGATWAPSLAPAGGWYSVASSADGNQLVAANDSGSIYISTNSGGTWTQSGGISGNLIVSSADGTKLMVAVVSETGGLIHISTNSGNAWFLSTNISRYWSSMVCSADGSKMAAQYRGDDAKPMVSTNGGVTWVPTAPIIDQGGGLACTADGGKLALDSFGTFSVSTNWGLSWSTTNVGSHTVLLACSANGSLLLGCSAYTVGNLYSSTNFGVTWTSNSISSEGWTALASSADGNQLVAVAEPGNGAISGGVWISQTTPSPQLNMSFSNGIFNFSWIAPSTNMVMQESPDLTTWVGVTNPPYLDLTNLQEELTLRPIVGNGFFRLISR
jgi:hypothetical protein